MQAFYRPQCGSCNLHRLLDPSCVKRGLHTCVYSRALKSGLSRRSELSGPRRLTRGELSYRRFCSGSKQKREDAPGPPTEAEVDAEVRAAGMDPATVTREQREQFKNFIYWDRRNKYWAKYGRKAPIAGVYLHPDLPLP